MPLTSGTIIANIPAGGATAIATGLTNSASTSSDNVITLAGSEYDLLLGTLGAMFLIKPLPQIVTFSAWETYDEAIANDIATEPAKGMPYFRSWFDESGNSITVYDSLTAHTPFATFYEFKPESTTPYTAYTTWETYAQAISTDLATETTGKGMAYFRDWFDNSGNAIQVYDTLMATSPFNVIFEILPATTALSAYTAWETYAQAITNDLASQTPPGKGMAYFRDWFDNSGQAITNYDTLMATAPFNVIFEIIPAATPFTTYTTWESRATAYSTDLYTSMGAAYFRDWFNNSGNAGNYEDHMDDTEMGTIFKIIDNIT